ncbi:MAG: hypothetical protein AAF530_12570 [Pseudomonadota bacterium]
MKKILLIALPVLFLLGGGGAGAYWWFFMSGDEAVEEAMADEPEGGMFSFEPFVIPVLDRGQVTYHLTMYLTLMIYDKETEPEVAATERQLKDAILTELHGLYGMKIVREQGFNSPLVHQRLAMVSNELLDEPRVTGIHLEIKETRK